MGFQVVISMTLSRHLQSLSVEPPTIIELDGKQLTVSGATLDSTQHPWAGQVTYQDLATPFLLGGGGQGKVASKIQIEFISPTTFKSKGHFKPFPLPELVFGSLLNRWLEFAPISLHPEVRRFAEETVVVSRYDTRTRGIPSKHGGTRIGFTGQVTFTALNRDRYWLNVLHLLAAFAFYSGVGVQTTAGLGQVRQVGTCRTSIHHAGKNEY